MANAFSKKNPAYVEAKGKLNEELKNQEQKFAEMLNENTEKNFKINYILIGLFVVVVGYYFYSKGGK